MLLILGYNVWNSPLLDDFHYSIRYVDWISFAFQALKCIQIVIESLTLHECVFFPFLIKITSGHRTLSRKPAFWTIRNLSKDYGRIWYGDRKYFSRRPSITQLRELKIPRRFERWQRRLKMYSRFIIVYRDYSKSHSFPHHNWFTCSRHYTQIIKL